MQIRERFEEVRKGFSRNFWVANTLELFERFAFYGSKAVLAVYLAEKVGLGPLGNRLAGTYGFAIFFLPILAGTIVDRYGFRRSLLACFGIFSLGYFSIGLAGLQIGKPLVDSVGAQVYVIGALAITAIGGSLIKPCIVGTVARTTTEATKSLGYSIYYTLVNFGGVAGPLIASEVRGRLGIEFVLVTSSLTSLLLLAGTFFFFDEPKDASGHVGEPRTMLAVLKDMLLVLANFRFIGFLVIFSGFWIMFWQIFYAIPFYVRDVLKFERFEWMESVGPFTIILLTVPVTALMKKVKPITAMTLAFAVASLSWLLVAAIPSLYAMAAAIAIFSVGETMQAPRFYEYVANLAPKDQVGTFMGFAFLPVAIGALVAGWLSGELVETYVHGPGNPSGMWFVLCGIGLVSTLLMVLYDVILVRKFPPKATE
ncbi:MAG: MFS transporter [Acidobacteria bacterium]|nr:MFS transporter [Acidobacteriota bacterium]